MQAFTSDPAGASAGLLVARLVIGLLMAGHGAQKLFGWFGGYGLAGTGAAFEALGFHPGRAFAFAASASEVAAGLLIALGFLGPIGPALMLSVMIVAAVTVHWKQGIFAATNGVELPLLYASAAVGLAFIGYGHYSIDAATGLAERLPTSLNWMALTAGAAGAAGNLMLRKQPAATVLSPET